MSWKNRLPWVLHLWVLAIVVLMTFAEVVDAQGVPELDIENDPEYKETQRFLANTQNIIAKVRAETDARAREIEALTDRVGELISNIGSTSEDASNLRSELSVVNDLLGIERQTTEELRQEMLALNQGLEAQAKSRSITEGELQLTIASLRAENTKVLQRLNELEAQAKSESNSEAELQSEIVSLRAENTKALKHLNELETQAKNRSNLEAKLQSTITSLHAENSKALRRLKELEVQEKSKSNLEAKLHSTIASLRSENTKALKRLNEAVETISNQANENQALLFNLKGVEERLEDLKEENRILKNRHRTQRDELGTNIRPN